MLKEKQIPYEEVIRLEEIMPVSETLSPLDAEEELASEKPMTSPPKFNMADSKLSLVRVLGS